MANQLPGFDLVNPKDDDLEDFKSRYQNRVANPFDASKGLATGWEYTADLEKPDPSLGASPFEPSQRFEDRRHEKHIGLLHESDLLAHARPGPSFPPLDPESPPTPLAVAAGARDLQSQTKPGYDHTSYLEKKDLDYSTKLDPSEEKGYQKWAKSIGRNPKEEEEDYDLRGYYKDVIGNNPNLPDWMKPLNEAQKVEARTKKGHLPDTYKKPNHPTFSDESIYHAYPGGMEPEVGGHWSEDGKTFTPSITNQAHWNRSALQHYFDKYEKGVQVRFPDWYK